MTLRPGSAGGWPGGSRTTGRCPGRSGCRRWPGAVLLKALRAAAGDLEHPHDTLAETFPRKRPPGRRGRRAVVTSSSLADALLAIAEAFLAAKAAAADDPEIYQVIVHVGTDALTYHPRRCRSRRGRRRGNAGARPASAG